MVCIHHSFINIDSFFQQIFDEFLQCARHYSRKEEFKKEKKKQSKVLDLVVFMFMWLDTLEKERQDIFCCKIYSL